MALKVGELFASFNLDTSGVSGAIDSAEKKMSSMGKSLMLGGAGMTAAITAPVTKAFTQIYSAGTDFDAEMSKVFAIAGDSVTGSAETMEALRNKALEMGSTTQFTATEAGEALEYMAMAGWKSEQMLSAIEPILNLAAAAGADLGTTSDIVTDAMTAFGLSATDTVEVVKDGVKMEVNAVEHFADVLAAASSNSNTNVTMLGESFKFAAPLAGAFGYSVDDVAIALGLMANNGIKSSMAGTSLSRIIQNMTKPSKETAAAMDELGLSLYNSRGEIKPLRELMGDFRNEAKKNGVDVSKLASDVAALDDDFQNGRITQEEYEESLEKMTAGSGDFLKNITQIAGARGLPGLLAIMNATDEDFEKLCASIDNATGSASEMKRVMLDNAKGDITIFKSAVEGLEITLWSLAENGFRKVVQEATKYVDSFRNADKSTQLGTLKMAGLAAAIGPVMTGLGGLIAILPKLARTFAIVSGPAALLSIGLVALGAAAIDSNNDIGKTFTKGMVKANIKMTQLGKTVKAQLPALTSNMSNFLRSLSTGIKLGLPGIISGLTDIITTAVSAISANMGNIANVSQTIVTTLANSIKTNAPKIVPAVLDLLTNMASALISNIPVVLSGMATVITSLVKEVQNADWGEIATKLRESLEGAIKETGTLFKKLAMGDKYTEEASWADVGIALVTNLMDGVKTGFGNLRDFVGSLLLADDYDPDEDWTTFGTKLIDKIFAGIDDATSGAESFVSGVIDGLADMFSAANISNATTALSTIVSRIITAAADEIPKLAGHATNILSKLSEMLLGDGKSQGTAAAATEGAMKLAGAIVTSITQAIPKALDAAGNVLNAGLTLAGGLLDSIAGAFTTNGLDLNVSAIVQSLVNNLVRLLPKAFETGGKVISAGLKIASELLHSITDGFGDLSIEGEFGDVAVSIVESLVTALGGVMDFGGELLSSGAKIANSIMSSISGALADLDASGVANTLGSAATDLVSSLFKKVGDLKNNTDVQGFITNLGKAFSSCMSMLGDVAGEIISYIFSAQGLSDIWDAGVSLGNLLIGGIANALGGIGKFFDNLIETTLINWGVIDPEEMARQRQELEDACEYAVDVTELFVDSMNNAFEDGEGSNTDIIAALFGYGINQLSGITGLDDIAPGLKDRIAGVWSELWMMDTVTPGAVKGAMAPFLESVGIALEDIPDTLWDSLVSILSGGDVNAQNELMNLLLSDVLGIDPASLQKEVEAEIADATTGAAEAVNSAKNDAIAAARESAGVALTEDDSSLAKAAESASKAGVDGMQKTLVDGTQPVSDAAYQLGDAAVQQFLLTMSEENGSAMAESFVGGIIAVLSSTDGVVTVAGAMGAAARGAAMSAMRWIDGYNIGHNFGLGLLRGIESMIDSVASAAAALGNAAAGALSSSIDEGSPSRRTAESGRNFDLGFINQILSGASEAGSAAAIVGRSAAESLEETIGEVRSSAADEMSILPGSRRTEAETLAAENERTAMTYASAIAQALSGARVMMNGTLVGELVTDTVSEGIANRYAGRRYGTV